MHKLSSMALAAATLALTACVDMPSISHQNVGEADTLATKADSRLVYARSRNAPAAPHDVICAEPSPEVAKAFSTAFGASAEAEAKAIPALSQAGDVRGALAVSRARSEAIAQLGKRLGTIQLLRNGLFSACEAYANGAISPISYAFLLSRFGDVMVTLLAVEMVSGDGIASDGTTTEATAPPPGTGKSAPGEAPQDGSAPGAQPVAADGAPAAMKKVAAVKKAGTADQANAQGGDAAPDKSAPGAHTSASSTPGQATKAGLSDAQTTAIVQLQQAYLRGSEAGPLVLACAVALDDKAQAGANGGPLAQAGSGDLPSVCSAFLGEYGRMVVDTVKFERRAEAQAMLEKARASIKDSQPKEVETAGSVRNAANN
ncbi:hypothetical protein AWB70_01767 [Caballeronia cordobensis]|uniref:Lipoprotein n=1 Tax=Caballeronia cordobensis TaxID=1353886 RepID=A0A158GCN8_CABCO|nr:hypothetical protein [Caballeronia cordobensis]SAL29611.1 hypothetical protein AWB70_01767 [Caballeronia cordobensis]